MTVPETKLTNPKDAIGSDKLPLHLWPATATAMGSLALLDGMLKYGRSNFRNSGVRASIYKDALGRHMDAWFEGEDTDPVSGLPHLAHALACIAIIVDADAAGKLNDDRMFPGGYRAAIDKLTKHVARLKALHADHPAPVHYTIATEPAVPAPVPSRLPGPNQAWFYQNAFRPIAEPVPDGVVAAQVGCPHAVCIHHRMCAEARGCVAAHAPERF